MRKNPPLVGLQQPNTKHSIVDERVPDKWPSWLVKLRQHLTTAIGNDCFVGDAGAKVVLNLEEVLPGINHTCLVDHSFWQSSSASSQVANILSEYKKVAQMVCDMARFVFLEQDKFSHLPKVDVNSQELRQWITVLPERLPKWVHTRCCSWS